MKDYENIGIDWGRGLANINHNSGIRYGVIYANKLPSWIWECFEPDYGEPTCPICGSAVYDSPYGKDYFCDKCFDSNEYRSNEDIENEIERNDYEDWCFWSDEVYPSEPLNSVMDKDGYKASLGEEGEIFIYESPYFTYAQFCSPCAPGACYLSNPVSSDNSNNKCYCLGPEYFEDYESKEIPYSIYSVKTGELVK